MTQPKASHPLILIVITYPFLLSLGPGPVYLQDMEFVSGYRDEFLDFAALLFGWFRKFVAERGTMGTSLEGRWRQLESQIRRLPQDPALWVLHVLPNRSVGISLGQGAEPGPGPGLGASRLLGDEPPLHLRDLSPYVSFVSLEDGEDGEEEEDEEHGEERTGTEKAEPQEGGEPAPPSKEFPHEAKPVPESEVTHQEASCDEGGREERPVDDRVSEKRKGRKNGKSPGGSHLVPCPHTFLKSPCVTQNPKRNCKLITFMEI